MYIQHEDGKLLKNKTLIRHHDQLNKGKVILEILKRKKPSSRRRRALKILRRSSERSARLLDAINI